MSVLEKLQDTVTGQRRENDWRNPEVKYDEHCGLTGNERMGGFATQAEHVLELRLAVTFWANAAQVSDARRSAEKVLAAMLYKDAHMALARVEHAIITGSRDQAAEWCAALRNVIEGRR